MFTKVLSAVTVGLGLHLVSACAPTKTDTSVAGAAVAATQLGDEILVGQSLGGEECRVRKTRDLSGASQVEQFEVYCGAWQSPSGFMWRLRDVDAASVRGLISDPASPVWKVAALTCDPIAATSVLGGEVPAMVRSCTDDGGWPHVVVGVRSPETGQGYVGAGLPHFAPVFEETVAAFTGRDPDVQVKKAGSRSHFVALAENELNVNGNMLSLDDIHNYREFTRLGTLYNQAGDFASAQTAHRSALEIQEKFLGLGNPNLGITLTSVALNTSNLGDKGTAERAFARAEPLVARSIPKHLSQHLAYKGLHLARHGDLTAGLESLEESLALRRQLFGPDSPQVAYGYYLEGNVLGRAGRHRAAAGLFENALRIFEGIGDPVWTAFTLEWLADTHRELGNHARAREYAGQAVGLIETMFGDGVRLTQALSKLALVERDSGRIDEALAAFDRAIRVAVTDRVAARYLTADDIAPYLDLLLEEAARRPEAAGELRRKAFFAAQAPEDRTTAKAIGLMAARLAEGDPAIRDVVRDLQDATERRQAAGVALGHEQLKDEGERDAEREATLRSEVAAAAAEASALERRLMVEFPRYGTLIAPGALDPDAVAGLLAPGEALVQALVGEEATFVFLIHHDGTLRAHKSAISSEQMNGTVAGMRGTLDLAQGVQEFNAQAAFDLYQGLFGEIDSELDSVQHLIVVPTGPLLSLPPAVLVREAPAGGGTYAEVAWLVRDMAVSVLPSVDSLQKLRGVVQASAAPHPFLGVGDPVFAAAPSDADGLWDAATECRENQLVDPAILRGVPALPESRDELRAIARVLGASDGSLTLGERATEANVRAANLRDYRTIAFATHGLLPDELPCQTEPALLLTPPVRPSEGDDGLLDASEVAQLELDADWVVLSACNTAGPAGELGGESLSGLARAFFYAGARSLLVTHWSVGSEAAVALTTGTFRRYAGADGGGKAEALRRTQLALIADPAYAHPAFWAAFTLVGDGSSKQGALVSAALNQQ